MIQVTRITTDHPDYAAIVKSITPVAMVHKASFTKNKLYSDWDSSDRQRITRRETMDKL